MFLLFLVTALGMLTMKHGARDAQAKAMANELTAQMRLAQARAIATQTPVAVVVPSANGSTPCSQSIYLAQGTSMARAYQTVPYATQYPEAVAFVGTWGLASGSPSLTPPATKAAMLNLNQWLPATMQQDYCFVFTPDGGVTTNGLPNFAGAYHLLVAIEKMFLDRGIHTSWDTLRAQLTTHQVVTVILPASNGDVLKIRKAGRAEPIHKQIYQTLGIPEQVMTPIRTWCQNSH